MNTTPSSLARMGLLALVMALGHSAANAQGIWKWRDKDGRIQISDRPPPVEVQDKDVLLRPHGARLPAPAFVASDAASDVPSIRVDPTLEAKKTKAQADQAAADKAKKDAEMAKRNQARAETCQRARNQITTIESGQRMARMNDKGEREFLDDNTRAAELDRTQRLAASTCD